MLESRTDYLFCLSVVPERYKQDYTVTARRALPEETTDYLASVVSHSDYELDKDSTPDKMLVHMLNNGASVRDIEDVFHLYSSNEMVAEMAYGYFEWEEDDQFPTTNIRELILGLRRYVDVDELEYSADVPIRRQSEHVQSQVQALIYLADFLEVLHEYQYEPGITMVHDADLAALAALYPERIGEIIQLLDELGEDGACQIGAIMSGSVHSSLSAGAI